MIKNTNRHVVGEFPTIKDKECNEKLKKAFLNLYDGSGEGAEMRDWIEWPKEYINSDEYKKLKEVASRIRNNSQAVVIIGIGGSYLTPRAVISSVYGEFYNELAEDMGLPRIYYAGCNLSPDTHERILQAVKGKDWSIVYISKSGGTMEPALAFRIFWDELYKKYGNEANCRVYAVTDAKKGILRGMADEHYWETFVIPDGIGGRYSGFTACGLLPIAIAGIDTDFLLKGAIEAAKDSVEFNCFAEQYARWRYFNYQKNGNCIEFFAVNDPSLSYLSEWLKQLFGESEGKDGEGLFPTSGVFPTDLHSLGQYLQDGMKGIIFETFIIRDFCTDIEIPESSLNDNLGDRAGKKMSQAAAAAMDGAYKAHTKGGNPCGIIRVGNSLEDLGYLMQAMFVACATSGYAIDVNPFDQPGVEAHKANMKVSEEWDKD